MIFRFPATEAPLQRPDDELAEGEELLELGELEDELELEGELEDDELGNGEGLDDELELHPCVGLLDEELEELDELLEEECRGFQGGGGGRGIAPSRAFRRAGFRVAFLREALGALFFAGRFFAAVAFFRGGAFFFFFIRPSTPLAPDYGGTPREAQGIWARNI